MDGRPTAQPSPQIHREARHLAKEYFKAHPLHAGIFCTDERIRLTTRDAEVGDVGVLILLRGNFAFLGSHGFVHSYLLNASRYETGSVRVGDQVVVEDGYLRTANSSYGHARGPQGAL